MLTTIRLWLRALLRRRALDDEMRDEMELHLARSVERLMARGVSAEDARIAARREFGNVGVLQEEGRDARGARWIESVGGDVRFALRHFARRPLMAVTIVLVLALGIGGHSAVFSILQAYTTRPAPGVPRDDALVRVRAKERDRKGGRWLERDLSYPEWRDLAAMHTVFAGVAGWVSHDGVVETGSEGGMGAARINFVTDSYFTTLGVPLALGPGLPPSRTDAPDLVAVIGHAMWLNAFGGRPDVIGQTVRVNDVVARIVGVAPPRFSGPTQASASTPNDRARVLWMPITARAAIIRSSATALSSRDSTLLKAFARLREGVSTSQATAAMRLATDAAVAQMTPRVDVVARDGDVVALRGDTELPPNDSAAMIAGVFGGIALIVLLVACTNVSALVVGAGVTRRQEIAIRLSLGASRQRVVRQLLTESSLLAIAGGGLGLLLYWWITRFVATQVTDVELTPDLGTAIFTVLLALVTGILVGLSPALHATRLGVADVLKDSGAGATTRSRLQRAFVVAQIVFTQPLLVGLAMLLVVVVGDSARDRPAGVDEHVIVLRIANRPGGPVVDTRAALARTTQRIAALPGVVAFVRDAQAYRIATLVVHPEDRGSSARATEPFEAHVELASPGYFKLLDIPILRGRDIAPTDRRDDAVVIGNDVARSLWGSSDPIGRRFKQVSTTTQPDRVLTVIGVYDSRYSTTRGQGLRIFAAQDSRFLDPLRVGDMTIVGPFAILIRTAAPAEPIVASVREIVRAELPTRPIGRLETLAQMEATNRRESLQVSGSAAAGGLLALLLASIGLYGVVALAVGQRRREIGVRLALGARAGQVVGMFLSSGVRLCLIGLMLGLPLSVFALRQIAEMARVPDTSMPLIGGSIAAVVLVVALLATWIPARRAATIDPVRALRSD